MLTLFTLGETSSKQSNPAVFGRTLLPAVLTLLFCIYVLFIQYTCSIHVLFFRIFFLATNRTQQLGNHSRRRKTLYSNQFYSTYKLSSAEAMSKFIHTFVCIYVYVCICVCVPSYIQRGIYFCKGIYIYICRKTGNNDPSGRNDLLTGRHYSVSVLLNHHQDQEG